MKLLLTAFDPFGGEPVNPALEAVKKVQNQIGSVSIVKLGCSHCIRNIHSNSGKGHRTGNARRPSCVSDRPADAMD